uniref:START domain-containing protein n=1 Tax=Kalanchoe fedtschenkoi TaxID=63787 RepID=A0A7N0VB52_KALFE
MPHEGGKVIKIKAPAAVHDDQHIIHKQFHSEWMPWGMKCRDLLLRRYWRRDDDGTYVILYHSVFHRRCPTKKGYVRACLKSGGYVISPTNQGKHSVVKHMLAIDWKLWRSYLKPSLARSISIKLLERVAALREMFRAKSGHMSSSDFSSGELSREIHQCNSSGISKVGNRTAENNGNSLGSTESDLGRTLSIRASLSDLNDAADEFFDVPEPSDYDHSDDDWTSNFGSQCQDLRHSRLSTAAGLVKKLHDAVQKKGYTDLQEMTIVDRDTCCYGCTLPKDSTCTLLSSYSTADPSTFLIRGKSFLEDNQKIQTKRTLMQLVGADWIKSDKKEYDFGGRPNSIVQKYAANGGPEFFFIVNFQAPAGSSHTLAFYYMTNTPLEEVPLLERFVNGDDAFRNSRFKVIPSAAKGPWIIKQTVRNKPCLIGKQIQTKYSRGKNYLEVGIDVGSSALGRGAAGIVIGYLSYIVIEMAFLIQADTYEELPEYVLGTCRLNHLDISKAVTMAT